MVVTLPPFAWTDWIWAAIDPVLIAVAVTLGWRANQFGKVFIAAIAALGVALLVDAIATRIGLPWFAPLSRETGLFVPVRAVAALAWSLLAYGIGRFRATRPEAPLP